MIPMGKPIMGEEEKRAVVEVLESGMLSQGIKVKQFEESFAHFVGTNHAVVTSSGTTALHAAILAHNIRAGDEVITTPFTFIATANAIRMAGATPVFVDVDEKTFNIDPEKIEVAITKNTKAILPVHLFGLSCNMDKIEEIARKHNLLIIEDACQSHGATWNGKMTGSFGTACYSFYPTKNMTTGEGGIITTNSEVVANKLRKIISHGSEKRYYHGFVGYNYRMSDVAAAIGIEQLKKLPEFNHRRIQNAEFLNNHLSEISGIIVPKIDAGHVFHQYTIRVTPSCRISRDKLVDILSEKGIASSVFYPLPVHKQEAYPEYNHLSFPITEKLSKEVLSLPIHPSLTETDLLKIVSAIKEVIIK